MVWCQRHTHNQAPTSKGTSGAYRQTWYRGYRRESPSGTKGNFYVRESKIFTLVVAILLNQHNRYHIMLNFARLQIPTSVLHCLSLCTSEWHRFHKSNSVSFVWMFWFCHSVVHPFTKLLIHSFIHSFIHLFIHFFYFVHFFIHSSIYSLRKITFLLICQIRKEIDRQWSILSLTREVLTPKHRERRQWKDTFQDLYLLVFYALIDNLN